jgi:hypothetical protein
MKLHEPNSRSGMTFASNGSWIVRGAVFALVCAIGSPASAEEPSPPTSAKPVFPKQRIAAIAVGGLGVAVGLSAIIVGGMAQSYESDAWTACTGKPEPSTCIKGSPQWFDGRAQTPMDQAISLGKVSTVLYIVSGVALGTGAALWFTAKTAPTNDTAVRFIPYVGPGNAGATVHFAF